MSFQNNDEREIADLLNLSDVMPSNNSSNSFDIDIEETESEPTPPSPRSQKTKPTFSTSSLNRLLLIALGVGLIAGGIGTFFQLAFNFDNQGIGELTKPKEEDVTAVIEEQPSDLIRGDLALGQQAEEIRAINDFEPEEADVIVETIDAPVTVVTPAPKPTPPPKQPTRVQVSKPQIKSQPKKEEWDELSDWDLYASLGSYGYTQAAEIKHDSKPTASNPTKPPSSELPPIVAANYKTQGDLRRSEDRFINLLATGGRSAAIANSRSSGEMAITGQSIDAKLTHKIQSVASKRSPQLAVVISEDAIVSNTGRIIIPAKSQIFFEIEIGTAGVVEATAKSVLVGNKEIEIPSSALSLKKRDNGVLIAEFKNIKNVSGNRDLISFGLGIAEVTSELATRPTSSNSVETEFGTSINNEYEDTDYATAILSEGASRVLQNRAEQADRQYSSTPTLSLWEIPKNTKLTIFVNRPFAL